MPSGSCCPLSISEVQLHESVLETPELLLAELEREVAFETFTHRGGTLPRLIAVQGEVDLARGVIPVYRHPLDAPLPVCSPWTPTVLLIKKAVEARLVASGCTFNHCLLQLYRSGVDFISEHADKTLDLEPDSVIVNYSLGAARTMVLRRKDRSDGDGKMVISLPCNSVFVLPLGVNRTHTHAIKPDRRAERDQRQDEKGHRISLTFRKVVTMFDSETGVLSGRGMGGGAGFVVHCVDCSCQECASERERLVAAFSAENKTSLSWQEIYGTSGFRVLTV